MNCFLLNEFYFGHAHDLASPLPVGHYVTRRHSSVTCWLVVMFITLLHYTKTVESGRSILLQCGTSFVQLLYSLSYIGFLVLMVGFLAGRAAYKGVVENYRESVYILITAVVTVPVALSWTVAGWMLQVSRQTGGTFLCRFLVMLTGFDNCNHLFLLQGRHQDACVSFGLVAHSLTTFLIMFMPKVSAWRYSS